MIKSTLIGICILLFINLNAEEVSLSIKAPKKAKAGEKILISATIYKHDIQGFARYQHYLPSNYTATEKNSNKGTFTFAGKKLSIQWMDLPTKDEVKISYYIKIPTDATGKLQFKSNFSFINFNSVESVSTEVGIEISGNHALQDSSLSTVQESKKIEQVSCFRRPIYVNERNESIVNIEIHKGDIENFGKIQEEIPDGYKAMSIESVNAIFTFKDNTIKFLWLNLPQAPLFVVSYKLVPEAGLKETSPSLLGSFSYAIDGEMKSINIVQEGLNNE